MSETEVLDIVLMAQETAVTGVILSVVTYDTLAELKEAIFQGRIAAQKRLLDQRLQSEGFILALPIERTDVGDGTVLFSQTIIRCRL